MSTYGKADARAQWFADNFPGTRITPNCGVLHTTEGMDWDGYQGGAVAPNYTAKPDIRNRRLVWRAHFPDEMSARALRNESGGVNTNTANTVQVELIGTCDETKRTSWLGKRAGVDYIFWPDAPEWALRDLAHFIADMSRRHGIKIQGPKMWLAYGNDERAPGRRPASFGDSPARMSFAQWRDFYGWCGHQHVPENDHGDPGRLDWERVERYAKELVAPPKPKPKPEPEPPAPVETEHPFTVALIPGRFDAPIDAWLARRDEAIAEGADIVVFTEAHRDRIAKALEPEGYDSARFAEEGPSNVMAVWDETRFELASDPYSVQLDTQQVWTKQGRLRPQTFAVVYPLRDILADKILLLCAAHLPLENTTRRKVAKEQALQALKDEAFVEGVLRHPVNSTRMLACDWNRNSRKDAVRDWFAEAWPRLTPAWLNTRRSQIDWQAGGVRLELLKAWVLKRRKDDPLDHSTWFATWGWDK